MRGTVECGAHEIVHCAVHHDERSAPGLFGIENSHEDYSGGPDQRPPWLDEKVTSEWANGAGQLPGGGGFGRRGLRGGTHSQPPAAIEVAQWSARAAPVS